MTLDIQKYCEYLYNSMYIPVYLYDNQELIACFPEQDRETFPPSHYLSSLWQSPIHVSYTMTMFYSFYGRIKIENSSCDLVIGPINDFLYTKETLSSMRREFSAISSNSEIFASFFHNIPTQNLDIFTNTLLFINYTLNKTQLSKKDIMECGGAYLDTSIHQNYSRTTYAEKEDGLLNNVILVENELLRYVETGNLAGIQRFSERALKTKVGKIANDNLRQLKNMFIVTVTLVSRAAIRGGLTPSVAYQLSNIYMQQGERLTDVDKINYLLGQVQRDYANRVANSISLDKMDSTLYRVIQYVRENTNKNITVADVAKHVGYSRPYLSRKVKKELGFDLSDFIKQCKLEEGKDLLAFSDRSISEISTYLCFSSQSHFQKSFKDKFGVTPQTYRKSAFHHIKKE